MGSLQPSYFQLLNLFIVALLECKAQMEKPCGQLKQLDINYVQGDRMSISCLTTTHSLESLTVKLRKNKDILIYPDNSLTSENQRWSVRKDAGNVTLDLKNIRLSDEGLYDCQVYSGLNCINATQFNLTVKKCKKLDSVYAVSGSLVLLPCSEHPQQNTTDQVTWKVVSGHQPTRITEYRHPQEPTNSRESDPKPFYMRAKTQVNGSLLIRDAVNTDELWYQCVVNEKTCYEVKLQMKDHVTAKSKMELETLPTTLLITVSADVPVDQTEGNIDTSATNLTVVVMATIVSLCVFLSLIICVILYYKRRKHKISSQLQLNNRFSVYYSCVAEDIGVPMYSLIEQTPATMSTFGAEQSEAPAFEQHDAYEIYQVVK